MKIHVFFYKIKISLPNRVKNLMKKIWILLCFLLTPTSLQASDYAYYGFEPDIIVNYLSTEKRMGYVRLTVELMIEDSANYEIVEHHSPLLRDAIIEIIGQQPQAKIKSINGRQEIQRLCEEKIKALLSKETGKPLIKKLLFTQWLDS